MRALGAVDTADNLALSIKITRYVRHTKTVDQDLSFRNPPTMCKFMYASSIVQDVRMIVKDDFVDVNDDDTLQSGSSDHFRGR